MAAFPENLLSVPPSYCQSFPTYHPAAACSIIHNIPIWKLKVERNLDVTPSTFSIDRSEPAALSARVAQLQILIRVIHYLLGLNSTVFLMTCWWCFMNCRRSCTACHSDSWDLIFNTSNINIDRDQHFHQKVAFCSDECSCRYLQICTMREIT